MGPRVALCGPSFPHSPPLQKELWGAWARAEGLAAGAMAGMACASVGGMLRADASPALLLMAPRHMPHRCGTE